MARAKSKPRGKKKTKTAATTPTVTTSPPPTAISSINANAKPISMNLADGKGYCFESGIRFHPPHTHNTLALLMKLWIPSSFVAVVLMGLLLWYGMSISFVIKMIDPYFPGTSTWLINNGAGTLTNRQVLYFAIFWRLMYNVFLGLMLRLQSDTKFLTRFIQYVSTQGRNSFLYKIINFLLKGTAGCHDPLHEYPAGFNAWLLNMQVVNIILPLDVLAFMVVVFRHSFVASDCAAWFMSSNTGQSFMLETPEWFCAGASYTATGFGIILGLMSVMGKRAAFDVIGHYAWFWGDFFYGLDLELKFDGIFDIAPHPMYTVGYGWMYGLSLMTGSSHVAALAFASHFMQIGFLILVEDPHINKLYGSDNKIATPTSSALASPTKATKSNVLLVNNFDIYRSSDWQLVSICLLLISVYFLGSIQVGSEKIQIISDSIVLGAALIVRVVGTTVQAFILRRQAKSRFWTNHFEERGQTVGKAFTEWKRLFNAIDTVMNLLFYIAAYRFFVPADYVNLHEAYGWSAVATMIFGVSSLLLVAFWAERSVFAALGDEGWFYGDFFIPVHVKETECRSLVYEGIYRYVNNPDVLLGKLWLYGLALATMRMEMGVLAFFCHAVAWFFLMAVEEPHMKSLYDQKKIRQHSSALTKQIKTKLLPKIAATARAVFYRNHTWSKQE